MGVPSASAYSVGNKQQQSTSPPAGGKGGIRAQNGLGSQLGEGASNPYVNGQSPFFSQAPQSPSFAGSTNQTPPPAGGKGGMPSSSQPNVPDWVTPPPPGAMTTQAFVELTNPATGETWMAPSGGYTVNQPGQSGMPNMGNLGAASGAAMGAPVNAMSVGVNPNQGQMPSMTAQERLTAMQQWAQQQPFNQTGMAGGMPNMGNLGAASGAAMGAPTGGMNAPLQQAQQLLPDQIALRERQLQLMAEQQGLQPNQFGMAGGSQAGMPPGLGGMPPGLGGMPPGMQPPPPPARVKPADQDRTLTERQRAKAMELARSYAPQPGVMGAPDQPVGGKGGRMGSALRGLPQRPQPGVMGAPDQPRALGLAGLARTFRGR